MKKKVIKESLIRPMGERLHEAVVVVFIAAVILFLMVKIVFF